MTNLKGLASIVSELKVERTNLANQLRHVDAASHGIGQVERWDYLHQTGAYSVCFGSKADQPRTEKAVGTGWLTQGPWFIPAKKVRLATITFRRILPPLILLLIPRMPRIA